MSLRIRPVTTHGMVVVLIALAFCACAGYEGDVKEIRSSLLAGNELRALHMANSALKVEEADHYPIDLDGENALLVLERGTIKQGLGSYKSSALDFRISDKHLEMLDVKNDTAGNIGKWLFSDDSTVYKAPPHEKLLLNTLNMLNYLSIGDLESARVEARRFTIMQDYLKDQVSPDEAGLGLGDYLAGFTFEMSGRREQALSHYDSALEAGEYPSLVAPIQRLAACDTYRTDRIEKLLEPVEEGSQGPLCERTSPKTGTILVVASIGLAPHKQARRIPIGAALVIGAHVMYGPGLGSSNTSKANELSAKGLLKWVMFPVMKKTRPRYKRARVSVDGKPVGSELGENVTDLVIDAWDRIKGTLMVAAITRMITRAVVGEAANQGAKAGGAAGGLALLAQFAVEGAMTAADTPDTRSWVTLPSMILVSRKEIPAGKHKVTVAFSGQAGSMQVDKTVNVPPGGFSVVSVASMR